MVRRLALVLVIAGCTRSGSELVERQASPEGDLVDLEGNADHGGDADGAIRSDVPEEDLRRIPSPVPSGDIVAGYHCSHSQRPFGTGYFFQTTTVDFKKAVRLRAVTTGDETRPGKDASERSEVEIDSTSLAKMQAALDGVLAGGPYRPAYPPPEGVSCVFDLRVGNAEPFFMVERAELDLADPVTALIRQMQMG